MTVTQDQLDQARMKLGRLKDEMSDLGERDHLTPGQEQRLARLLTGHDNAETDLRDLEREYRSQQVATVRDGLANGSIRTEHGDGTAIDDSPTRAGRARNRNRYAQPERGPNGDAVRAGLNALDRTDLDARSGDRCEQIIRGDSAWAARFAAASSVDYENAFLKVLRDPQMGHHAMTDGERDSLRTAMSVGSNTNGGFLVPTHLDPTIIVTSSGWTNPLREISRVVTLTNGNTWNGVTSAGVVASFDAELAEVSDDSPADLARVAIPTHKAQAFIQYSIEAEQDIGALRDQLVFLLADARSDLEASKFASGTGTGEPTGIWTALDANTNVEIVSTTAATIGEVDVHSVYRQVPVRWRRNAKWLMNPLFSLTIKRLGTSVSSTFSGDLTTPAIERILGHEVVEDDDAPSTQTTTALDNEVIFGSFDNFVIVDRAGMAVELVPHILGANRRPIGARGLYAWWRVGSDSVNDVAFRLLQDKTSA